MNTIKIILILFATLAYAEDFHEIKSQIQEEFNKNMLAKKNIIDAISTEVKNSFNEFKQHYEKIENRLCACADKNDTIFYCKLIKSEINLAYSLLQREFFALEMQAVAIDMFGSSIQLYEATLNSISNFTSAASCLIKTKSLFIGLFRSYFETTRDTIVKHVRKLEDGILVTQAEIDNFIAQRDANISLCAAKGESECDCTSKYVSWVNVCSCSLKD